MVRLSFSRHCVRVCKAIFLKIARTGVSILSSSGSASGVVEMSEKVRCATFLHGAGEEAIKVSDAFVFAHVQKDTKTPKKQEIVLGQ